MFWVNPRDHLFFFWRKMVVFIPTQNALNGVSRYGVSNAIHSCIRVPTRCSTLFHIEWQSEEELEERSTAYAALRRQAINKHSVAPIRNSKDSQTTRKRRRSTESPGYFDTHGKSNLLKRPEDKCYVKLWKNGISIECPFLLSTSLRFSVTH